MSRWGGGEGAMTLPGQAESVFHSCSASQYSIESVIFNGQLYTLEEDRISNNFIYHGCCIEE